MTNARQLSTRHGLRNAMPHPRLPSCCANLAGQLTFTESLATSMPQLRQPGWPWPAGTHALMQESFPEGPPQPLAASLCTRVERSASVFLR